MTGAGPSSATPFRLAIAANAPSNYRNHLHERLARELPGVEVHSLFFSMQNNVPYAQRPAESIHPRGYGDASGLSGALPAKLMEYDRRGRRIVADLDEIGPDMVIVTGWHDTGKLRVLRWCASRGVPSFVFFDGNIHTDRATGLARAVKKRVLAWVSSRASGFMPCGSLGQAYLRRFGVPDERMFLVPHAPDDALIRGADPALIDRLRSRFGLRADRRYVMTCCRLVRVKRPDLLVEAFVRVADGAPGWDLLFVGDGPLRGELESMVPEGLSGRVHFTGFVDKPEEVAALYRVGSLFVLPSEFEPWAAVVPEAGAAGLPIICSDVVGAGPELVEPGRNGYLFPSGDVGALARSLGDLIEQMGSGDVGSESRLVWESWRRRADPVAGVASAAMYAGVAPAAWSGVVARLRGEDSGP